VDQTYTLLERMKLVAAKGGRDVVEGWKRRKS
jgi:hypothetical protein